MSRTRIKICGITRPEDATFAAQAGADAIGLVFAPASPRCVTARLASEIVNVLPAFVDAAVLFVNAEASTVRSVTDMVQPSLLQFHGDESVEFCAQFDKSFIRAVRVTDGMGSSDLLNLLTAYERVKTFRGMLLDAPATEAFRGHAKPFDWTRIPAGVEHRLIVAGGLTAETVGGLVKAIRPYAVDVSSGVESAPGIKDHRKIEQFIRAVALADEVAS